MSVFLHTAMQKVEDGVDLGSIFHESAPELFDFNDGEFSNWALMILGAVKKEPHIISTPGDGRHQWLVWVVEALELRQVNTDNVEVILKLLQKGYDIEVADLKMFKLRTVAEYDLDQILDNVDNEEGSDEEYDSWGDYKAYLVDEALTDVPGIVCNNVNCDELGDDLLGDDENTTLEYNGKIHVYHN